MADPNVEQFGNIPLSPNLPSGAAGVPGAGACPPGATNTGPTIGGGFQNQGQQNAPDFLSVARNVVVAAAMSAEGMKYVKDLKETIAERSSGTIVQPKVINIPYPPETLCVYAGNNAFLLVFSESNQKEANLPTVALERIALESMRKLLGTQVKMWNVIIVTPEDYPKCAVMAAYLVNALAAISSPEIMNLTIQTMRDCQLEISTNPANYEHFIARFDPHGVAARADLKITVSLTKPRNRGVNHMDLFDQVNAEKMEIGVIGAYVIFSKAMDPTSPYEKFIPEVHISNITTMIQYEGLIPLMLAIATESLIDNKYWMVQFSDLGPGSPNIGNLIDDPNTGQPFRCENLAMRDNFITAWCAKPALILDVMEGRARIPGIEQYAMPNTSQRIIESYNKFLNNSTPIPLNAIPAKLFVNEYTGYIPFGAKKEDSRWCSYLNMMIHHANQKQACAALLSHYSREEDYVNAVRHFFPELDLHYVDHLVILQPEVLRGVQAAVRQAIRTINGNSTAGTVDNAALLAAGNGFLSSPTGVYYSMASTPFSQLYGSSGIQGNLF